MEQTIQELVAPTSLLLMDPAVALADLGLDSSLQPRINRLVKRVSAACIKELLFNPCYRKVAEGFESVQDRELLLSGRPLNAAPAAAVLEVIHPAVAGDPHPDPALIYATDYTIRCAGRPSGEGSVFSTNGWPPGGMGWSGAISDFGAGFAIDWQVTYWHGWWLPLMTLPAGAPPVTGSVIPDGFTAIPPDGVPLLPDDIQEACWISVRKLWFEEQIDPNWQGVKQADREITFRRQIPNRGNAPTSPENALSHQTISLLEIYQPVL